MFSPSFLPVSATDWPKNEPDPDFAFLLFCGYRRTAKSEKSGTGRWLQLHLSGLAESIG